VQAGKSRGGDALCLRRDFGSPVLRQAFLAAARQQTGCSGAEAGTSLPEVRLQQSELGIALFLLRHTADDGCEAAQRRCASSGTAEGAGLSAVWTCKSRGGNALLCMQYTFHANRAAAARQ